MFSKTIEGALNKKESLEIISVILEIVASENNIIPKANC